MLILKRELRSHYLVTLIWLAIIVFLRLVFNFRIFFNLVNLLNWLAFCLGAMAGTFLLDTDQLISAWFFYPESPAFGQIKLLFQQKKFKEIVLLLADTYQERTKLPFHNAVFQVVLMVFSFWVITSTGNWLGKGMVMALGVHLLKDELELIYARKEAQLKSWLFWQIKREVSFQQQKIFVVAMLLVFLGLNLLLV